MNCSDYRDRLSAYVDGALEAAEQARLQAHLNACAGCAQELTALKDMLQALRTMETPQAPDLLPGIHRRLQPVARRQFFALPWPAMSLPWHGLALAATALLVVVVVGIPQVQRLLPSDGQARGPLRESADQISAQYEPFYTATVAAPAKITEDEQPAPAPAASMFEESRQRVIVPQAPEDFSGFSKKGAMGVAQTAESDFRQRLGASVELASAGSGGFEGADKDSNEAFVGAKSDYRLAAALDRFKRSGFMESPKRADQGFANAGVFKVERFLASGGALDSHTPELLQVRWQVSHLDEAVIRVTDWVNAHEGFVTLTAPNHLSVVLPGSAAAGFLQEFSNDAPGFAGPFAAWVSISLELVPPQ